MALASNTKEQLAKRLKADLQVRFPTYTVNVSSAAGGQVPTAGDPLLTIINASSVTVAVVAIDRLSYNGFNVVAELSSSAAEGLPEHVMNALVLSSAGQLVTAQLFMAFKELSTASIRFGFGATVNETNLSTANLVNEWANTARYGQSGQ